MQAFGNDYRCVRFTLPGFDVPDARKAYTLDDLTNFIARVVEQVSPHQPVILLLHDWGCLFGYQFAQRYPYRVASIIGVDVGDGSKRTPRGLGLTLAYQGWLALAWWLGGGLGNRMTRALMRLMHVPKSPAEVTAGMNYPYFLMWFGERVSYLRAARPFAPAGPMLYVYGQDKPLMFHTPGWLRRVQQRPGSRVVSFDTGHWVMLQQPERFNRVVKEWLRQGNQP
ncbi:alpha/beta fold hydrolase [Deinococcus cavernae]|uniref:alpha/beta fold hydrolase n=1 Tax=Deinococcus cavernae TaxID=2320857 RepID=UPI0018F3FE2A|nr:alpha/beta hydrolase [Deinococcus cavernae]